ncbi:MAG: endopeptidase La [Planctomycetota bacterium]
MARKRPTPETTPSPERSLPLLALREMVLFPGQVTPVAVGRPQSKSALEAAAAGENLVVAVPQRDPKVERPGLADLEAWGTVARILKVIRVPDGSVSAFVQAEGRVRILGADDEVAPTEIRFLDVPEPEETPRTPRLEALELGVRQGFERLVKVAPQLNQEHLLLVHNAETPGALADLAAAQLPLAMDARVEILAETDAESRLALVHRAIVRLLDVHELSSKIESDVQSEISQQQREHFLRSQMRAIRHELGDADDEDALDELRERAVLLPEAPREAAERELRRLSRLNPSSPEYGVARNYLDWLFELPWETEVGAVIDLAEARRVLDRDHHDLDQVKKRIVEYLAVRKLKRDMRGPILCLVGPPGVGKTSLGRSIANALGRPFQRVSLGGMHDEAEIRGHRRTYIGALPGRILQAMRKAGSRDPVIVLDEIDKLGRDWHGDPASALLEVLDPEQNANFSDHYVEVPFDLSRVLFVATANGLDSVPAPLRDRMEIIEIPGYADEDKVLIAEEHLIPKQIAEHGLLAKQLRFRRAATKAIIANYTREAGVRGLERRIADVARAVARRIADGEAERVTVGADDLQALLGAPRFDHEEAETRLVPGVATGLAWTPTGGEILFIEVSRMPGTGRLKITGQLGEVMRESAEAAMSWLRAEADRFGLAPDFHGKEDVHVHVPAGAVPKDGPSAGVALVTALVSAFTDRAIRPRLAMTGEITLRGRVLPVGGIKEKLLGARRAGIRRVILPERNRRDTLEIPEAMLRGIELVFVSDIEEALRAAFPARSVRGDARAAS